MPRFAKNNPATLAMLLLFMLAFARPASAQYSYQVVLPPGADGAETFGINDAGKVAGSAWEGEVPYSFVYDMKKGTYETVSYEIGVLEINNAGEMVGDVEGFCAMRDKKGIVSLFSPPSYGEGSFCQGRGVNANGKVSGFTVDEDGNWSGFIYDARHGTFEEFLPSPQTIAHGINAQGQNVGSVFLFPDEAYPGSPAGRYGYLRQADGAVKHFAINPAQAVPGTTRARGISGSGLVAGFYIDAATGEFRSYVTTLASGTAFEEVTLADEQVVHQSPCNADLPPPPGPGYELVTIMTASQVRNDGVVVGVCFDDYVHPTEETIENTVGFIATPEK